MIEQQLYITVLLLAAGINVVMACSLMGDRFLYRDYPVYRRSRMFTGLVFLLFAAGFLLHHQLGWRSTWPEAATALSVSYFHMGAVLFSWSHISLLNPSYLTTRIAARDICILLFGLVAYWVTLTCSSSLVFHLSLLIFFGHASYVSVILWRTMLRVRRETKKVAVNQNNASWWTAENRQRVIGFQKSIRISCHMIILFGLGSVLITASFPHQQWPYTLLLGLGICVFCYIFYGLSDYGSVIEAGTNVTEDVNR